VKKLIKLIKKVLKIKPKIIEEEYKPSEKIIEKIEEKQNIKIKNINWDLIKKINTYDIIIVKMLDDEIIENDIEESHQIRPFIVEEKDDSKETLKGHYLTSNIKSGLFYKQKYSGFRLILRKENYKLNKTSVVIINDKIDIPYENINKIIDSIKKEDLKKLKKYIELVDGKIVVSNKENLVIEIGDIIKYNEMEYIIFQIDNSNCYAYNIIKTDEYIDVRDNHQYTRFDKQIYYVEYKNNITLNKFEDIEIIDRFDECVVERIRENKKLLKLEKRKVKRKTKKRS